MFLLISLQNFTFHIFLSKYLYLYIFLELLPSVFSYFFFSFYPLKYDRQLFFIIHPLFFLYSISLNFPLQVFSDIFLIKSLTMFHWVVSNLPRIYYPMVLKLFCLKSSKIFLVMLCVNIQPLWHFSSYAILLRYIQRRWCSKYHALKIWKFTFPFLAGFIYMYTAE